MNNNQLKLDHFLKSTQLNVELKTKSNNNLNIENIINNDLNNNNLNTINISSLDNKTKQLINKFSALKLKAFSIKSSKDTIQRNIDLHQASMDVLSDEFKDISDNLKYMEEAFLNLKLLIEKYSFNHIKEIEDMVTFGLKTIFYDENYSFKINISEQKNNKHADFFLIEEKDEREIITPLKSDKVAGGILVVCGFILQVYFIQYFKLSNIIIADECFSQLSSSYINGLFTFIDRLKEKMDIIIILVTHDDRFMDYADKIYIANKGVFSLADNNNHAKK